MKHLILRLITGLLQLQCAAATLAADTDVFVQTAHSDRKSTRLNSSHT